MKQGRFRLTIDLGNDTCLCPHHVATKLQEVSKEIKELGITNEDVEDHYVARLLDSKGNTIGQWEFYTYDTIGD
jgi:hypothetical protein